MRDPVLVFICFERLLQQNEQAFEWACDVLELDIEDREQVPYFAEVLEADFIRFGRKFAVRDSSGDINIWDPDTVEWTTADDELVALIKQHPFNPLREKQEGYLESIKPPVV